MHAFYSSGLCCHRERPLDSLQQLEFGRRVLAKLSALAYFVGARCRYVQEALWPGHISPPDILPPGHGGTFMLSGIDLSTPPHTEI